MLVAALLSLNLKNTGLNNALFLLFMLTCSFGHLIMMKFMSHKHQDITETKAEIITISEKDAVDWLKKFPWLKLKEELADDDE